MNSVLQDCKRCGEPLQEHWRFCSMCGCPVPSGADAGAEGNGQVFRNQVLAHSIFHSPYLGVIFIDREGCIREANQTFEAMIGYEFASVPGTRYLDLVHPYDEPVNRRYAADVRHGKCSEFSLETRFLRGDGSFFWGRIYGTCDCPGGHECITILITDVTRQKEAESEVRHLSAVSSCIHDTTIDIMNRLDYMDLLEAIVKRAVKLARA